MNSLLDTMIVKIKNKSDVQIHDQATGIELAREIKLNGPADAVGMKVNGVLKDLSTTLSENDEVEFLSFADPEGQEIFWHSSAHILAQAVLRIWPDAQPTIGPPIKNGFYYDFANLTISDEDFKKIEKEMQKIVKENLKPERSLFSNKQQAIESFKDNPYKTELIKDFPSDSEITAYRQGDFFDLCRGPHLYNTGKIKALKVLKTSGAYWKGDSNNEMLTRIYAITFPDKQMLKDYLYRVEQAKLRDHRLLGQKLGLFMLRDEAPGLPFFLPHGMAVWNKLIDFWREIHKKEGYIEIKTPQMMTRELWETSGHWHNYKENMYTCEIEERDFAIKPMNCPGCMLFYKSQVHSYRELPMKVAELGLVHRYEHSGALSGLFRVRGFHQDDAHIFMEPKDIKTEILGVLKMAKELYSLFDLTFHMELSTRPEKDTIGTDEEWETATLGLKEALDATGQDYRINEGDGAFYGPKIDFHIQDALGRSWQCGTIQLDMALPEKFELEFVTSEAARARPVMIHRALFGSVERFFGILIEHFAGKFPLWLSPRQIRVIAVADRHADYAKKLQAHFETFDFLCDLDISAESVGKKIRNAQLDQVNYILTVGDRESENETIALRTRDNVVHGEISVEEFVKKARLELKRRDLKSPFHKQET